jgi:spore germination protein YaaH
MYNKTILLFLFSFLLLFINNSKAQTVTTKAQAFAAQPNEVVFPINKLQELMNSIPGQTVSIALTNSFYLIGTVQSNTQNYTELKSAIIKLTNYPNVVLGISKITELNKPERYVGRIISSKYSDAYELVFENNAYSLKKIITEHVLQPCN